MPPTFRQRATNLSNLSHFPLQKNFPQNPLPVPTVVVRLWVVFPWVLSEHSVHLFCSATTGHIPLVGDGVEQEDKVSTPCITRKAHIRAFPLLPRKNYRILLIVARIEAVVTREPEVGGVLRSKMQRLLVRYPPEGTLLSPSELANLAASFRKYGSSDGSRMNQVAHLNSF